MTLFLILLLTTAVYSYVRKCGFVSDDKGGIEKNTLQKYLAERPFFYLCKRDPRKWHITLLGLHLIAVSLFYFVCSKLFGSHIATIATLLFAIHPCTVQCVAWLSGRHYTLIGIFVLAAILKPLIFIPLMWLSAILHPQGLMLALVAFVHKPSFWNIAYCLFILLFAPRYLKMLKHRIKTFEWSKEKTDFKLKRINMFVKIFSYYFYMATFPFRLGFYHAGKFHYDKSLDDFNYKVVLKGLFLFALITLAISVRNIYPSVFLGIIWFFLFLIPCINIIDVNMVFSERYMYVPLIGYCMALAQIFVLIPHYEIILTAILTLYAIRTISYTLAYKDEFSLFAMNIRNHPRSLEANSNLGDTYLRANRSDLALPMFEKAVEIDPNSDLAWFNLGCACANLGNIEGAERCWKRALEINPQYINPRYNLMRLKEDSKKYGWQKFAQGEVVTAGKNSI